MIDFHTHILPGIDDGSQDIGQTEELLRQAHAQGVDRILATPHFYADQVSVGRFLERREQSRGKLQEFSGKEWMPEIRVAAEVYYFPGMGKAEMLPRLCMEGSSLLLLEMPFAQWTNSMYREIETILEKQKLTVLLAHVERYYEFQKDKSVWDAVFELPVYAQINAGSFARRRKRSFNLKFLKEGHKIVLGSDCHHPQHRPSNLQEGRDVIKKKLGEAVLGNIDTQGRKLWEYARCE